MGQENNALQKQKRANILVSGKKENAGKIYKA